MPDRLDDIPGEHRITVVVFRKSGRELVKEQYDRVEIVATDPYRDLALLRIVGHEAGELPFLPGSIEGGRTVADLTESMYQYHDNLRAEHAASSPWWLPSRSSPSPSAAATTTARVAPAIPARSRPRCRTSGPTPTATPGSTISPCRASTATRATWSTPTGPKLLHNAGLLQSRNCFQRFVGGAGGQVVEPLFAAREPYEQVAVLSTWLILSLSEYFCGTVDVVSQQPRRADREFTARPAEFLGLANGWLNLAVAACSQ